jgi:2,5-furandicarboxylate decarboxylase 1
LDVLNKGGDLIEFEKELSPRFEIPAAIKYVNNRENKAVLFKKVNGYPGIMVVGNLLGHKRRLAQCLNCHPDCIVEEYLKRRNPPIKPLIVESGPVKDVIIKDIDIQKTLPVATHHAEDAGPYITCGITVAKHPETGIRGMGVHRIQVKGKNKIGIFLATPPLSEFLRVAEEKNMPLEIATVIGADPLTFFSAVTRAPEGVDKFDIAGGLANAPIELVKTEGGTLEIPANAEIVLEGSVIPGIRESEGPFGESTGYYFAYENPVAEINCITHRKNPIYQGLVPFTSEEDVLLNVSWEAEFLRTIQDQYPQVKKVHLKASTLGISAVIQMCNEREGLSREILNKFFDINPFAKVVVIVDDDVDVEDPGEVDWAIATRVSSISDIMVIPDSPGMPIDPSVGDNGLVVKVGIDAVKPFDHIDKFRKIDFPKDVKEKIWSMMKEAAC